MKTYRLFWFSTMFGVAYVIGAIFWLHHSVWVVILNATLFIVVIYIIECPVFKDFIKEWWVLHKG